MRYLLALVLLLSTLSGTGVRAQEVPLAFRPATSWHLTTGLGVAGYVYGRAPGRATIVEAEIARTISPRFSLLASVGVQFTNFTDNSINTACPFVPGDKLINFSTEEKYETRRTDLSLRLGGTYRLGKLRVGLAAVPALRLGDRLTLTEVTRFFSGSRPDQTRAYNLRPGENYLRFPETSDLLGGRLEYERALQLRADLSFAYALGQRFELGLRGRQGLTADWLTRYTTNACDIVRCIPEEQVAQRLRAEDFQLLLLVRVRL